MSSALKACLVVLAVLVTLSILAFGVGWFWWSRHGREFMQSGTRARDEGVRLGKTTSEGGCLDEALRRHRRGPDFQQAVVNAVFLKACLAEAAPTPGFCDGVPSAGEVFASARWAAARCQEAGFADGTCPQIFTRVQEHCAARSARPRPVPAPTPGASPTP